MTTPTRMTPARPYTPDDLADQRKSKAMKPLKFSNLVLAVQDVIAAESEDGTYRGQRQSNAFDKMEAVLASITEDTEYVYRTDADELRAELTAYKKLHDDQSLCQNRQAPCAWAMKLTAERETAHAEILRLTGVIRSLLPHGNTENLYDSGNI